VVEVQGKTHHLPYARCVPAPSASDPVAAVFVDPELGDEAFTYRLRAGAEGSVHVDQVLDYNKDPSYLRDLVVYRLTIEAQKRVAGAALSKREIIRRLGTSAAQFYRLLDQTNYSKSIDQMLRLLNVLDCEVDLVIHAKTA
jgi:hypothetical protein